MIHSKRLTAAVAVPLFAVSLAAQPANVSSPTKPSSEEVVQLSAFQVQTDRERGYRATNSLTATRTATSILDTPLNITVLTEDFMEDIDAQFLNDSLNYVSSVSTTTLGNNGRQGGSGDGTRIRGFEISFALRNGFRRDRNVTIRNIERVEVVKGPVAQLFGQTAPGGLLNYITKRPSFERSGSLRATVGSFSLVGFEAELQDAYAAFGSKNANVAWRVLTSREEQDLYRDFEFREEDYFIGQVAFRPVAGINVLLEHEYMDTKSNLAQGLPRTNPQWMADWRQAVAQGRTQDIQRWYSDSNNWANDIQARTGVRPAGTTGFSTLTYPEGRLADYNVSGPDTRFNNLSNSTTLDVDWAVNDTISLRYGANNYAVEYFEKFNFVDFVNADGTMSMAFFSSRNNRRVITTQQLDAVAKFETGDLKHTFVVGGEDLSDYETVRRLAFDPIRIFQQQNITRAAPPPGQPDRGAFGNAQFYYDPRTMPVTRLDLAITTLDRPQNKAIVELDRTGYFASYRGAAFGGRLNVMAGLRREEADTVTFSPFSGVRSTSTISGTTASGGVNFRLRPSITLFAGYSESFEPSAGRTATGPLATAAETQPLGPVEGQGLEAGVKVELLDGRLSGTLSAFSVERSNIPSQDVDRTRRDPRNFDTRFPDNVRFPYDVTFFTGGGAEEVRGVDGDFVWAPSRPWQFLFSFAWVPTAETASYTPLQPGFGFRADGTQVRLPDLSQNGLRLARTPEWSQSLWAKYSFQNGNLKGLSLGLGLQHKGEYQIFQVAGAGAANYGLQDFMSSAYTLLDAVVTYDTTLMGRPARFMLSGKNLTDKEHVGGTYTFGEPFRAQLSARLSF
jgi:iron complex outermembrane receptor protein